MKKYSPLIALTLLAGCLTLSPLRANAQDEKQDAFRRDWYDTCFQKKPKDEEKCYQQSKEMVEKYPSDSFIPNAQKIIKAYEKNKVMEKFQAAYTAYSNAPDAAKLDQLFAASDECLKGEKIEPAVQQYVLGRVALAGTSGAMAELYKNLDKVKEYAENTLKSYDPAAPPEGWKKEAWELRATRIRASTIWIKRFRRSAKIAQGGKTRTIITSAQASTTINTSN